MHIEVATKYFPRCTEWHVRQSLKWISPEDINGVKFIRLLDSDPSAHEAQKHSFDVWSNTHNGQYVKHHKSIATHINLYPLDLYLGIPLAFKFSPVATLKTAFTLAHEVGHHLVTTRRYIYVPTEKYKAYGVYNKYEEEMCDSYAFDVMARMLERWGYKLGLMFSELISTWHIEHGKSRWAKRDYKGAAFYWYCAHHLFRGNGEAFELYDKAIGMLDTKRKQKVSDDD